MHQKQQILSYFFIIILISSLLSIPSGTSCKDIVITPAATAGDYSLFLKIRDPSRPGLQVLSRVPQGTPYTYHHPWTGKAWEFFVNHTYLGVATQGDTLPNIVKAGMVLTDAGLAFGDADTLSKWVNPTKYAWDDFDWIRYACQSADNEDEAASLLTSMAVDELHAPGVSENLFVVGPQKALVIEADATHSTTHEIADILVMSNYAKDLWKTQLIRSLPIASSFNAQKETIVRQGRIIHLGSICGVKVLAITQSSITVRVFPVFAFQKSNLTKEVTIPLGERATVGPYSATLLEITGRTAKVSLCTSEYAWEQTMLDKIQSQTGNITIQDMIRYSRFHTEDLDGLRPMCEEKNTYEAAMVYRIPTDHATLLSSGWFAANHPCSSIFVPVHICDDEIDDSYETGDAAALSLALLQKYGHGNITAQCESVEHVFYTENEINEAVAHLMIHAGLNITSFLTEMDTGMQEQAFLTEQLLLSMPNVSRAIMNDIWSENYETSQEHIRNAEASCCEKPGFYFLRDILGKISLSISNSSTTRQQMKSILFLVSSKVQHHN